MPQKQIKIGKLNCNSSREWAGDSYLSILLSFLTMCKPGSPLLPWTVWWKDFQNGDLLQRGSVLPFSCVL